MALQCWSGGRFAADRAVRLQLHPCQQQLCSIVCCQAGRQALSKMALFHVKSQCFLRALADLDLGHCMSH